MGSARRPPAIRAFLGDEVVADNFAGGGGASTGIELALGRSPDIAVNHDEAAIAMHAANHPTTTHYTESVWEVDPRKACGGKPVALAWFSPDCKHHSKAKGGKPREQKIRGLAWVAVTWAHRVRPRVIALENVEEFREWGPLHRTGPNAGKPIKARRGETFRAFVRKLERLGYVVEHRLLRACDFGAPTTRRRLFLIARCDGLPIVWPAPTHGKSGELLGLRPYRTAAECIDWSIPCPSIFDRDRPLADKTLARIARGVRKFVLESARPFVIPVNHGGPGRRDHRVHDADQPMPTITGGQRGGHAVVQPIFVRSHEDAAKVQRLNRRLWDGLPPSARAAGGYRAADVVVVGAPPPDGSGATLAPFVANNMENNVPRGVDEPLATILTGNHKLLVTPMLVKAKTHGGGGNDAMPADEPLRTVTASKRGEFAVASATLVRIAHGDVDASGKRRGLGSHDIERPLPTVYAGGGDFAIAVPYLVHRSNGERVGQAPRIYDPARPLGTIVAQGGKHAVCAAFLAKHYGGNESSAGGSAADRPVDTITTQDHHALVAANLVRYNGDRRAGEVRGANVDDPLPTQDTSNRYGAVASHLVKLRGTSEAHLNASAHSLDEPMPAVSAQGWHMAQVAAFLVRYNGTGDAEPVDRPAGALTTKPRYGLVTVTIDGEEYVVVDIGMRMLEPRELFRAQGFTDDYKIAPVGPRGKPLTKTEQIRMCGNSVSPPVAAAIVRANLGDESRAA